tara:strand:- start:385 stop:678 length:294 start_codon:yes stop_codon:yes gene_type:complete
MFAHGENGGGGDGGGTGGGEGRGEGGGGCIRRYTRWWFDSGAAVCRNRTGWSSLGVKYMHAALVWIKYSHPTCTPPVGLLATEPGGTGGGEGGEDEP